jgi:two-component system, cell cycle sensor histidine kinase and response regulator CckA
MSGAYMTEDHRPPGDASLDGGSSGSPDLPGRGEVILIVEDDDSLRPALARMLQSLGFSVLSAANGLEAAALIDNFPERIDVLLTDVVMPELDGPGLVKRLAFRGIRPGVIYMSGFTDPRVLGRVPRLPATPILTKPFTLNVLIKVLREVLDSQPGR